MRIKANSGPHASIHLGPAQWVADSAVANGEETVSRRTDRADAAWRPQNYGRAMVKGGLQIDCLSWEEASYHYDDWRALAAKAIETNVFNEPEFALSAAQHFPPASRPVFLFVRQTARGNAIGPLAGVFALRQPSRNGNFTGHLWCPPEMAVATPLIHPDHGFAALDLLQDWLGREFPLMNSFMMPMIPAAGNFAGLLQAYTKARGLQNCQFDLRSRAVLNNAPDTADRVLRWMGRKRHKEMRRLWRRLSECGPLEFMTAKSGAEIKSATEFFMALEAMGWKGDKRSALLCDPSLATFTRTMSRRLSSQHNIEIDALTMNREPIAMAVILRSGREAYFWKTTYKESFAQYSPGVLLALSMTSRLLDNPDTRFINSCAVPNHPMIDHLWPDRVQMMDIMVGVGKKSDNRFIAAASLEGGRRKLRSLAKQAYYKLRGATPT